MSRRKAMFSDAALAAATAAEAIRALNHATLSHDGYTYPSDVDAVLIGLVAVADRAVQAVEQAERWLLTEHSAGRIGHDTAGLTTIEDPATATADAVSDAVTCLRVAAGHARVLGDHLRVAQQSTAHMTAVRGES